MATYSSGNQTREILIEAAGELAAEKGFSNVSIRAVAQRARQNIGSIHYHFKTKMELFKAVIHSVIQEKMDRPLSRVLAEFEDRIHLPEVQAKAIRALVMDAMDILRNPKHLWWHSRVIYQTMQRKDELWELLNTEFIDPEISSAKNFLKRIKPGLSDEEAFLHAMLIKTPIIFHADNAETILSYLGRKNYSDTYLKAMENKIVRQTLMLLGIPEPETAS